MRYYEWVLWYGLSLQLQTGRFSRQEECFFRNNCKAYKHYYKGNLKNHNHQHKFELKYQEKSSQNHERSTNPNVADNNLQG